MKFSDYCDTFENTDDEQRLLQFLEKGDLKEAKKVFSKLAGIPVIGKLFAALTALSDYESIAAFKASGHYENIKDWDFKIDLDKRSLSINPNEEQKKKFVKVVKIVAAVITIIIICRKIRRRGKRKAKILGE